MCDTVVVVPEKGPVWFAKNSNREPSEAQFVECHDGSVTGAAPEGLPDASSRARLLLSRPAWMWGAEIGVNEHGVAIGNEAVFTRLPVPKAGYSGMDFQRVALTTCSTADDALEGAMYNPFADDPAAAGAEAAAGADSNPFGGGGDAGADPFGGGGDADPFGGGGDPFGG